MVLLLVSATLSLISPPATGAPGFRAFAVATGLAKPVGITFLPNGVLVYAERQTGQIRFRNLTTDGDRRVFTITHVNGNGGGGALGVAIHPNWPNKRDLYVYATRNTSSGLRNQILRVDLERRRAKVILSSIASPPSVHHGGRIVFGPDGKLYVVIGDDGRAANAQTTPPTSAGRSSASTRTGRSRPTIRSTRGSGRTGSATPSGWRSTRSAGGSGRPTTVPNATMR